MSSERERTSFPLNWQRLLAVSALAGTNALVACSPDQLVESTATPLPSNTPAQESTPTPIIETDTPTVTVSPTPTPTETEIPNTPTPEYSQSDIDNWEKIQGAESESMVTLENPLITHIVKIPRPGPDAFYGILKVQRQDGNFQYAIIENFDCEHEEFLQRGNLRDPVDFPLVGSGVWPVKGRPITKLDAQVFVEYAAGTIPWLISDSFDITDETETISCPKSFFIFREAGEAIVEATRPIIEEIIEFVEERLD